MITNNPEHKKAVLRKLGKFFKTSISLSLAGTILAVGIFVYDYFIKKYKVEIETDLGHSFSEEATPRDIVKDNIGLKEKIELEYKNAFNNYESVDERNARSSTSVMHDYISDKHKEEVLDSIGKKVENIDTYQLTKEDYEAVSELDYLNTIEVYNDSNLGWLNNCPNLYSLNLDIKNSHALKHLNDIKNINVNRLTISMPNLGSKTKINIDKKYFEFLENCPNLNVLTIDSEAFNINSSYLSFLAAKNEYLHLILTDFGYSTGVIEIDKLKDYSSVTLKPMSGDASYDMPILLSREDFKKLCSLNLKIDGINEDEMLEYQNKVMGIYDQIDNITKNIPIHNGMSDEEKLKYVLKYVIDNVSYNEKLAEYQQTGKVETDMFGRMEDYVESEFEYSYKDGMLYGVLANDAKAICGNYAALMNVLLNHFGVESHNLHSAEHAYNLVNIDGQDYLVDATFLDSKLIDFDDIINSKLHLMPSTVPVDVYDTLYSSVNITNSNLVGNQRAEEIVTGLQKQYKIKINNEIISISVFTLISILLGLGLAIVKRKSKKNDYKIKLAGMSEEELKFERNMLHEQKEFYYNHYYKNLNLFEKLGEKIYSKELNEIDQINDVNEEIGRRH